MIIPYKPEHLEALDLAPVHRALLVGTYEVLERLSVMGLATTVVSDDELGAVIAVLGAGILDASRECEIFMFPSRNIWKYRLTFWKGAMQELKRMKKYFRKLRALGTDTAISRRFFEHLGFKPDGFVERVSQSWRMWTMDGCA